MTKAMLSLSTATATIMLSTVVMAGDAIPSPYGPTPPAEPQTTAAPIKVRPAMPLPSQSVAPASQSPSPAAPPATAAASPSKAPESAAGDKDAIIRALTAELEKLRAGKSTPASSAAEASSKPLDNYQNGLVGRIYKVAVGGGHFGNERTYDPEPDAIFSFPLNATRYNLGEQRKGTNVPRNELIAYRNIGFYQAKEGGRHVFRTTIERDGRVTPDNSGAAKCMLGVLIDNQAVSALSGTIEFNPRATNTALTTAGGIDLEPGFYAIEWDAFCSVKNDYLDLLSTTLEIQTPSDISPSTPQPGMLQRKEIKAAPKPQKRLSASR